MNYDILIIDDDLKLCELLKSYLGQNQLSVDFTENPHFGIKKVQQQTFDLLILDLMLPEMSGLEVCKTIRQLGNSIPIIILSAKGEVTDKILGLELGADDYLAKPFEPRELLARIHSLLRRKKQQLITNDQWIKFKEFSINFQQCKLWPQNDEAQEIIISVGESNLLATLIEVQPKIASRDLLSERIRGIDSAYGDRSIDIMIYRLRAKLNEHSPELADIIKTHRGRGYSLTANAIY